MLSFPYVFILCFCMLTFYSCSPVYIPYVLTMYGCITATKYIKVLQASESRTGCSELFLFASRLWWLTFINCQVFLLDMACYHLELYSIVSRCVLPLPAVRGSRTFCKSARLPAIMIWIAYDASCIIWRSFLKISDNSYYTRLYRYPCIQCLNAARLGAGPLRICAGAGMSCRCGAVPGDTPHPGGAEKQTGVVLFILYIYFSQPRISKMTSGKLRMRQFYTC